VRLFAKTVRPGVVKELTKKMENKAVKPTTVGQRAADGVASFGGSWKFIFLFAGFLAVWVLFNVYLVHYAFDRPPFILLNLCLSFIAAFQAPFIMMSQNRQGDVDRSRAIADFEVNVKSELEIADVQQHLHYAEETITTMAETIAKMAKQLDALTAAQTSSK
jgi:uncharacterized membrane protein